MQDETPVQPAPFPPQKRRRPAWLWPAVIGSALIVGVLGAAAIVAVAGTAHRGSGDTVAVADAANLGLLFEPAAAIADDPGTAAAPDARRGPLRERLKDRHLRLRDGEKVVAGSVVSSADGKLVVRKDSNTEVTVPTDGDTRVAGAQNKSLGDLGAGERVIVKVGADGKADRVLAVKAHAAGTVTELDGDRATVVRPGGLSVTLDLSGVSERPAAGTVVVAVGTATDGGATLKVEQLKELPTLG